MSAEAIVFYAACLGFIVVLIAVILWLWGCK